jgi:hypothetical protein
MKLSLFYLLGSSGSGWGRCCLHLLLCWDSCSSAWAGSLTGSGSWSWDALFSVGLFIALRCTCRQINPSFIRVWVVFRILFVKYRTIRIRISDLLRVVSFKILHSQKKYCGNFNFDSFKDFPHSETY